MSTAVGAGRRSIGTEQALSPEEVARHIRDAGWAVMAVLDGPRPYAIPMAYGFDGRRFFVATGPGRKRRALEQQPRVCLTIIDVPGGASRGGYVVVTGHARPVTSFLSRIRAGLLILRRFSRGGLPSFKELRRMAKGRIFRIEPGEVTGRLLPA